MDNMSYVIHMYKYNILCIYIYIKIDIYIYIDSSLSETKQNTKTIYFQTFDQDTNISCCRKVSLLCVELC